VNTLNPGYYLSAFRRVDEGAQNLSKYIAFSTVKGAYHLTDAAVRHPDSHGAYLSEQRIKPYVEFFAIVIFASPANISQC